MREKIVNYLTFLSNRGAEIIIYTDVILKC